MYYLLNMDCIYCILNMYYCIIIVLLFYNYNNNYNKLKKK